MSQIKGKQIKDLSIDNSKLINDSISISGNSIDLGSSLQLTATHISDFEAKVLEYAGADLSDEFTSIDTRFISITENIDTAALDSIKELADELQTGTDFVTRLDGFDTADASIETRLSDAEVEEAANESSINTRVGAEESARASADSSLDTRLNVVQGDSSTVGSIAKAIADVIDAAPEALNTLNEIAASLGDDANYAATITAQVSSIDTRTSTDEAALATEISATNADVSSISTRVSNAEDEEANDVSSIDSRIAALDASSSGDNSQNAGDISSLETRVLGNETSFDVDAIDALDTSATFTLGQAGSGTITIANDLEVNGHAVVQGDLDVEGNVVVGGDLDVDGTITGGMVMSDNGFGADVFQSKMKIDDVNNVNTNWDDAELYWTNNYTNDGTNVTGGDAYDAMTAAQRQTAFETRGHIKVDDNMLVTGDVYFAGCSYTEGNANIYGVTFSNGGLTAEGEVDFSGASGVDLGDAAINATNMALTDTTTVDLSVAGSALSAVAAVTQRAEYAGNASVTEPTSVGITNVFVNGIKADEGTHYAWTLGSLVWDNTNAGYALESDDKIEVEWMSL